MTQNSQIDTIATKKLGTLGIFAGVFTPSVLTILGVMIGVGAVIVGIWALIFLRMDRWYTYTDHVAFERVAKDVKLGRVVWEPAVGERNGLDDERVAQPSISSDETRPGPSATW